MSGYIALLFVGLIALNVLTFGMFGVDKKLAESGSRRISEAALLQAAFFGGTPGAYAGRAMFRHKTRKVSFSNALHVIAGFQLCALIFAAVFFA